MSARLATVRGYPGATSPLAGQMRSVSTVKATKILASLVKAGPLGPNSHGRWSTMAAA